MTCAMCGKCGSATFYNFLQHDATHKSAAVPVLGRTRLKAMSNLDSTHKNKIEIKKQLIHNIASHTFNSYLYRQVDQYVVE